ncbi:NAD(P)-dependent oxidoreductase [Pseudoflavitalea sp. G-6-1-2]|uniref:NAD(P)-dependent oxidoreductase n=1 Tax=Pseudoflavitalea sp. G-6-1-2 TaxID=2728841 RepID=UPI00146B5D5B|nr:NAD(P)-binding domain-containing protein [Pseudoflavitalea sp. G-6-1-2]NML21215.1 NAD(P)-dependent oxidoreductase [Pseudoflavitalea sp. G-6-1-2]
MTTGKANEAREKVTVIGLGSMGSAIAGAFVSDGFDVTVWNRDASKAAPLVAAGATAAPDLATAIQASPLVVTIVSDYKVSKKIFDGVDASLLHNRTLVQLSTGTPKEAREFDAWVQQNGGRALNGDILAWPRQVGTPEATITMSGNQSAITEFEETLKALGTISYVGNEPGASAVMFNSVMAYLAGSWIGFVHGALITENAGLPVDAFGSLIANISPMLAEESKHMGNVIHHGKFTDPESTINTTALDLHMLVQHSKEAGIGSDLPEFAANLFQRAVDAGFGKEEHAAIIKVMR